MLSQTRFFNELKLLRNNNVERVSVKGRNEDATLTGNFALDLGILESPGVPGQLIQHLLALTLQIRVVDDVTLLGNARADVADGHVGRDRGATKLAEKSAQRHVGRDASLTADGVRNDGRGTMVEQRRREMIHEVGQSRRQSAVVLGSHEDETIGRLDLFL